MIGVQYIINQGFNLISAIRNQNKPLQASEPKQRWVLFPCGNGERGFENSREGHGETSHFSLTIGVKWKCSNLCSLGFCYDSI